MKNRRAHFESEGHLGPIRVLSRSDARRFLAELRGERRCAPLDWEKGWAAAARPYYTIGAHPTILAAVTELLGEDVVLWGATLVKRPPSVAHPWHCDVETADRHARTVTVWLGLKNCCRESSLMVIPGSHRFGATIQELSAMNGVESQRDDPEHVLELAKRRDSESRVEALEANDGEAILFDGRLWHGSSNDTRWTRTALLLQYATTDTPIRIPCNFDWPFRALERPRPPCVLVSGEDRHQVNRIVPGPVAAGNERGPRLSSQSSTLDLPLAPDASGWKPYSIFHGTTTGLRSLSCHASALVPGYRPHAPHGHDDEELLLVLDGEADLFLPQLAEDQRVQRLRRGEFVYYPAGFLHTIEGAGDRPVNYLMLKWCSDPTGSERPMRFARHDCFGTDDREHDGFRSRTVFEGPTAWLYKLHCHTSTMAPGAGYEPHTDAYDVAIVVLEGELESLGDRLSPHGVYFYAAGEPHGARNNGSVPARYVVFELHGRPTVTTDRVRSTPLWQKLRDPRRWRSRVKKIVRHLRRPTATRGFRRHGD